MSAVPQYRPRQDDAIPAPEPEPLNLKVVAPPDRENPIELLRDAIARLKSSEGGVADQAQVADLLAEAGEALKRARTVARAVAESTPFLKEERFPEALLILDAALLAYPADPTLISRRREAEARQKAFLDAAAVRAALEEASWLLTQERTDLAVQFLQERSAAMPDQPVLGARLDELSALLPQWEQKRNVQAALGRAASLEQTQQWQAALTVLEEALQAYPAARELSSAAKRLRKRLAEHELQKKLARRLELIGQKIASQSWKEAVALVEGAHKEFPSARELPALRAQAEAGLRQSERQALAAEVRQHLADGELDRAGECLRRGVEALGTEPALDELRAELEADRKYREELRQAQVLFGRRRFQEAEAILVQLAAATERPEAAALLAATREARAATEEEDFCERGRLKALELIQDRQFAPAVDLLENLVSLFPGNRILKRDLEAAQSELDRVAVKPAAPPVEPEIPAAPPPAASPRPPKAAPVGDAEGHSRLRLAAIAGAASLVLVSGSAAAWKMSRHSAGAARTAAPSPPANGAAAVLPPAASPSTAPAAGADATTPAAAPDAAAPESPRARKTPAPGFAASLREFVPPSAPQAAGQAPPTTALPLPPGTDPNISAVSVSGLPAGIGTSVSAPAPPPAPAPQAPPAAAPVTAMPATPTGGKFQEAQLVQRTLPAYPQLARMRAILGEVKMEAVIDEYGIVKNVKVLSGDPILAQAARTSVGQWKYKPATLNGKPISTTVTIQISFGDRNK